MVVGLNYTMKVQICDVADVNDISASHIKVKDGTETQLGNLVQLDGDIYKIDITFPDTNEYMLKCTYNGKTIYSCVEVAEEPEGVAQTKIKHLTKNTNIKSSDTIRGLVRKGVIDG